MTWRIQGISWSFGVADGQLYNNFFSQGFLYCPLPCCSRNYIIEQVFSTHGALPECSSAGSEDTSSTHLALPKPSQGSAVETGGGLCLFTPCRAISIPWDNSVPSLPQGVGCKYRGSSEHADPPQRGRAPPEVQQRADGDVLQGQVHRRVGHGLPHGHHPAPRPGGAPRRRQRGGLRWQVHRVSLRGQDHQGKWQSSAAGLCGSQGKPCSSWRVQEQFWCLSEQRPLTGSWWLWAHNCTGIFSWLLLYNCTKAKPICCLSSLSRDQLLC